MSTDAPAPTQDHDATGRFKPGNKAGRRKGRRAQTDSASAYQKALLAHCAPRDLEQIISSLCILAKSGDVQAAREVFDRVLGRIHDKPLQLVLLETQRDFEMPAIESPRDLPKATQAIAEAVAALKIDDKRAQRLLGIIEQQRRNLETVSLQEELDAIKELIERRALPSEGQRLRLALGDGEEVADEHQDSDGVSQA